MARPTSKHELLKECKASRRRVLELIDALPPHKREAEFAFDDRDRCVRDVLVHLHVWHLLLLAWEHANTHGDGASFLPDGYTWNSYAPMNVAFRDAHAHTSLDRALELYGESYDRVIAMIESHTDGELFTKKHYPWTGSTSLGAYCVSSTSSHDEWALKKLRRHARA
ncbi:ClbS/DfsB family four-helix bundle protein [Demequina aestuarii]|uniref:ClbS/DfsB family four-helix bundle protein n=1 Tax=Demequina aestuarii TaxID=327095 RepID=UPI00078222A1|nr:ClbS/DfsB family four-helix bundle protein [Demequina aestuarii]